MPRWTKEQDAKLQQLFKEGQADPHQQTPEYIRESVWKKQHWLKDHPVKNFYPLYRRKADEWIAEQGKSGSRK